jgi:hypothetical protein
VLADREPATRVEWFWRHGCVVERDDVRQVLMDGALMGCFDSRRSRSRAVWWPGLVLAAADPDYSGVAEGFVVGGIILFALIIGLIVFAFALPDLLGIFPPKKRKKKPGEATGKVESTPPPVLPPAKASMKDTAADDDEEKKTAT